MGGKDVSDEALLNTFRTSSQPFLKTSEVEESVTIGRRAVQKRLNKLEEAGRIEKREIGQASLWWLADDEPEKPIGEEGARLMQFALIASDAADIVRFFALLAVGTASFLMVSFLFLAEAPQSTLPLLTTDQIIASALSCAIIGTSAGLAWGILMIAKVALPKMATRRSSAR